MRTGRSKTARGLTADQKQKISLGRGLVRYDVNAILFDEPLTVIDPHMKWVLRSQLKRLHKQFGYTMVYVTHDQTEALTFADRVVVMYDGEIVQIGTPAELFERPAHTFVGYFIGSPGMNVMPARIDGTYRVDLADETVSLGFAPKFDAGAKTELGIRPEFVRLGREGMPVDDRQGRGHRPPQDRARRASPTGRSPSSSTRTAKSRPSRASPSIRPPSTSTPTPGASAGRPETMEKTWNNKAWFLVLPVLVLVAFSAVIPLMTVVNYSVQDTFGNNEFFWAGTDWFDERAPLRPLLGSARPQPLVLGDHPRHRDPARHLHRAQHAEEGAGRSGLPRPDGAAAAHPVERRRHHLAGLRPRRYRPARPHAGSARHRLQLCQQRPIDAWITLIVMDVWHWTSLVVLLCYAGLVSIPEAYYQAAKIDGASRWSVFRYIELPKMKRVLLIAVLLRFMDSFMIYTEPFVVTGGGPGNSTTFLSIDLVKMAIGQFDLGPAAAMSIIYFLIILLLSWIFYTVMTSSDGAEREEETMDTQASTAAQVQARAASPAAAKTGARRRAAPLLAGPDALHPVPDAADLLARQHELQDQHGDHRRLLALAAVPDASQLCVIFTDPTWYKGYINSIIYVVMNTVISVAVALPAAYAFSRYRFLGDKHLFFWLLTNRMAPPAVFALPFFQLYSAFGLIDTHIAVALAHCLFNVPLAVWILEGFMSGVPKEIDETAYIDGYSFPRFFVQDLHAADRIGHRRRRLLLLHVLLGRAAARPHADDDRRQADRRDHDPHGLGLRHGLGRARRRRRADDRPRRARDLFRPQLHRQGLCPGEGLMDRRIDDAGRCVDVVRLCVQSAWSSCCR